MRAACLCLVAVALAMPVASANSTGGTRCCASADARFTAAWESRRGQPLREVPVAPPVFNGHPRFARPYSLAIIHFALRVFHNAESNFYAHANAKIVENCRFYIENTDVRDDRDSFYWNVGELCRAVLHYGSKGDIAPGRLSSDAEAAFCEMAFGYCHDMSRLANAACDDTKTWRVYESENHHVQRASALWQLMHVLLKADPAYGARILGDGGTLRAHYAAWEAFFCAWMRERAKRSMFIEVQSRGYGIHTIKNIYPLHDFSDDPATRRLALTDGFPRICRALSVHALSDASEHRRSGLHERILQRHEPVQHGYSEQLQRIHHAGEQLCPPRSATCIGASDQQSADHNNACQYKFHFQISSPEFFAISRISAILPGAPSSRRAISNAPCIARSAGRENA